MFHNGWTVPVPTQGYARLVGALSDACPRKQLAHVIQLLLFIKTGNELQIWPKTNWFARVNPDSKRRCSILNSRLVMHPKLDQIIDGSKKFVHAAGTESPEVIATHYKMQRKMEPFLLVRVLCLTLMMSLVL